jgi:3-oxoacyl-[acyl-carrier-protein] synthase II
MTGLAITGWSALCGAGTGTAPLLEVVRTGRGPAAGPVGALYDDALPADRAHAHLDFSVRESLGRKGTSLFDRWTAFAVLTCDLALRDGQVQLDLMGRDRVGVVLGTTVGGLKSTSDFSRETLVQERPYLVPPSLFPNTVMNCGAGQSAIWFGLTGVNATLAGGKLAFPQVLRYSAVTLRQGRADLLLAGAVEEFTPHTAWLTHLNSPGTVAGEGAAVFVLEPVARTRAAGRHLDAEILAVVTAHCPGDHSTAARTRALAGCAATALARAGVEPRQVDLVATGGTGIEPDAVVAALGRRPATSMAAEEWLGECQAASAGLQLALVLAVHRLDPARDGAVSLLTAHTEDGGVAAWVIRGWCRANRDHG